MLGRADENCVNHLNAQPVICQELKKDKVVEHWRTEYFFLDVMLLGDKKLEVRFSHSYSPSMKKEKNPF